MRSPIRSRAAAGLGLLIAAIPSSAVAVWRCTDMFGHGYVVANSFGDSADVRCESMDGDSPVTPQDAAPPASPVQPRSAPPATGGGLLVLAPPVRGPAAPLGARRREVDPLIESTALEFGLDPDLLRAIVAVESRFDPGAISPRGAIGLMQVMPSTAAELGVSRPEQSLLDPLANLRAGARHLQRLLLQFPGAIDLALAAYNAGAGSVLRCGLSIPPFPETQAYVHEVLEIYWTLHASR